MGRATDLPSIRRAMGLATFAASTLRQGPDDLLHGLSRKAVAVGRNFREHAREMNSPVPSEPFWFFKPSTSYLRAKRVADSTNSNSAVALLPPGAEVHHEVELAAVIRKRASHIPASSAMDYVAGYVCAVDLTARNWQAAAKKRGHPWALAKGCDTFLPISPFVPIDALPSPNPNIQARLWLRVNGELRQDGNADQMIFPLPELIEHITRYVTLEEWDLVLTGTPAGVGQIVPGDIVTAGLGEIVDLQFECVQGSEGAAYP